MLKLASCNWPNEQSCKREWIRNAIIIAPGMLYFLLLSTKCSWILHGFFITKEGGIMIDSNGCAIIGAKTTYLSIALIFAYFRALLGQLEYIRGQRGLYQSSG